MMKCLSVFTILATSANFCNCNFGPYKVIDLTHPHDENAKGWPTLTGYSRKVSFKGTFARPDQWLEHYEFTQDEHIGTHIDAPVHFTQNGRPVDQIPLNQLAGPGVLIDIRAKSNYGQSNYEVTVDDFKEWEKQNGKIPEEAIILLYSGKAENYHDVVSYYGYPNEEKARQRDTTDMKFPGMSEKASLFLRDERKVNGIGIDSLSMDSGDKGTTNNYIAHRIILGADIWILENVGKNMKQLLNEKFFIMAMPFNLKDGSGAPTRVVAMIGNGNKDDWMKHVGATVNRSEKFHCGMALILTVLLLSFLNSYIFNE